MKHDWIEWNGGECPVAPDAMVKVQFRCDTREQAERVPYERATMRNNDDLGFRWTHGTGASDYDIVAYKVKK